MILREVSIQNFLGFGKRVSLRLDTGGVTLIDGDNGAGKTSIIDAILWCLYGKTLRGYKNDAVVNRFAKKDCFVDLDFEDAAGTLYRLVRCRRHKLFKNSVALYDVRKTKPGRPGKNMLPRARAQVQPYIDRVLGMTFEAFASAVVFRAGDVWSFCGLEPSKKAAVLDQVLGLTTYAKAEKLAREKATEAREQQREAARARDDAALRATEAKRDGKAHMKEVRKFAQSREKLLKARRAELRRETEAHDEWSRVVRATRRRCDKLLAAEKHIQRNKADSANVCSAMNRAFAVAESRVHAARDTARRCKKGTCPACERPLPNAVSAQQGALKNLQARRQEWRIARTGLRAAERDLQVKETAWRAAVAATEREERRYTKAKAEQTAAHNAAALCRRSIKELKQGVSPHEELAYKAGQRLTKEMDTYALQSTQYKRLDKLIKRYEFWIDGFSARGGVRSAIVKAAAPFLNQAAAEAAQVLTDGAVRVRFETQRLLKSGDAADCLHVAVENSEGAADYAGCSDGEKASVNVCTGAALSAYQLKSARCNVVFFDEPFDHMDAGRAEKALTYLLQVARLSNVFIVTHDSELKAACRFRRVVTVRKVGRQATLEVT